MRVIDLDNLVPENKTASLGGVEYALPGDMPLEIYLRINNAAGSEDDSEADAVTALLSATGDLFGWVAPEADRPAIKAAVETTLRGRGVKFLMEIVRAIYGEDAAEPEETPTTAPEALTEPETAAGTTNTTPPTTPETVPAS